MWSLSTQTLQALSNWGLAVAGLGGVITITACLIVAFSSSQIAARVRSGVAAPIAIARAPAAPPQTPIAAEAVVTEAPAPDTAGAVEPPAGPEVMRRRASAFAALIRSRIPELALVVGHGAGAHDAGVVMREALKGAGVSVRWCRLKPEAEASRASALDGLAVYADPTGPDALPLVKALQAVGFKATLTPARHGERGLPSPSIYFATASPQPRAAALALCTPVVEVVASAGPTHAAGTD